MCRPPIESPHPKPSRAGGGIGLPPDLAALVARYHQAFNDRDFDVWREVFDEDIELVLDGISFHGVDAAVAYGIGSVSEFRDLYIVPERVVAESGDTVVTEIRMVNRDPAGGPERRQGTVCEINRVRDGRIVSCRSYYMAETEDGEDALRVPDRREATRIAEEQAALRRVATLVARAVPRSELFGAVAKEVGRLLSADFTRMLRYENDGTVSPAATWAAVGRHPPVPERWTTEAGDLPTQLFETRRPARIDDWTDVPGPIATFVRRALGNGSSVGSPIIVEGRPWGALVVHLKGSEPLPADTESRLLNFTELVATAISNSEARAEVERLADEQAGLRRVATLVAHESSPAEVFAAVGDEMRRLLRVEDTSILRYETDGTATVVASSTEEVRVGDSLPVEGSSVTARVFKTGRPARLDNYSGASGRLGSQMRQVGIRSAVGAPIVVEGRLWGVILAATRKDEPLPAGAEARVREFTELVATAISNVQARSDLAASRRRIVAAADDERRRVVRDLHDGAQQRLVHTLVMLNLARQALDNDPDRAPGLVNEAIEQARETTTELRELAHGILPAVLVHGGLPAGVEALASRAPVPVEIDVSVGRLPAWLEATAYFVVAEALTNVAKHAHARGAAVSAGIEDGTLRVAVRDDGVGGARSEGSGLVGLRDRLSVLDGRLRVESPPEGGTLVAADIPLRD